MRITLPWTRRYKARKAALGVISAVDNGGVPFFVTSQLRNIAAANDVMWRGQSAADLIEELRTKVKK